MVKWASCARLKTLDELLLDIIGMGVDPVLHFGRAKDATELDEDNSNWCCHDAKSEMRHAHGDGPDGAWEATAELLVMLHRIPNDE